MTSRSGLGAAPYDPGDGRFSTLLDDDGAPPHGEECDVCQPFSGQRPEETRRDWLRRLTALGWPNDRLDGLGYTGQEPPAAGSEQGAGR